MRPYVAGHVSFSLTARTEKLGSMGSLAWGKIVVVGVAVFV